MATILKFKRYTTATLASLTGEAGELIVDTDKDTITVHDGVTAGGKPLATESYTDNALDTALTSYYTSVQTDSAISTALLDYDTSTTVDFKVSTAISNLVDNAPGTLDTLNELAAALADDENYASTITTALGTKANSTDVDTALALKANITDVDTALALKADLSSPALTDIPTAPTATLNTNTTQIATTEFAMSQIAYMIQTELPAGFIGMWSGSAASIPTGWLLCDGTNSTPDLRDRFIVGAGTTYAPGDVGGSANATLTTNELPAHTHTGTTATDGSHDHNLANVDAAISGQNLDANNYLTDSANVGTSFSYNLAGTNTTPTIGNSSTAGSHTHTFTTDSEGVGAAFDIRPPYYALCFIMKDYPVSI